MLAYELTQKSKDAFMPAFINLSGQPLSICIFSFASDYIVGLEKHTLFKARFQLAHVVFYYKHTGAPRGLVRKAWFCCATHGVQWALVRKYCDLHWILAAPHYGQGGHGPPWPRK